MRVHLPDYNTYIDFPDGTPEEEILSTIQSITTDKPDIRNLSPLYGRVKPRPIKETEPPVSTKTESPITKGIIEGLLNTAGLIEGGLSTISGLISYPISWLAGLGKAGMELATSGKFRGYEKALQEVSQDLTYQPITPMGKTTHEVLSSPFALLGSAVENVIQQVPEQYQEPARALIDTLLMTAPLAKPGRLIDRLEGWKEAKAKEPIIKELAKDYQEAITKKSEIQMLLDKIQANKASGKTPLADFTPEEVRLINEYMSKQQTPLTERVAQDKLKMQEGLTISPKELIDDQTLGGVVQDIKNNNIKEAVNSIKDAIDKKGYDPQEINHNVINLALKEGAKPEQIEKTFKEVYSDKKDKQRVSSSIEQIKTTEQAESIKESGTQEATAGRGIQKEITSFADTGGYSDRQRYVSQVRLPIEGPEAVEILNSLIGKYPAITKRLRHAAGKALGVFYPKSEIVKLRADLAKDPDIALKVLSHEIGHVVDYLPERTLSRGNILGRIASLKNYFKNFLEEYPDSPNKILTNKDRNRLRREAERQAREQQGPDIALKPEEITAIWTDIEARTKDKRLYDWIAGLSPERKAELLKAAIKGVIPDWVDFNRSYKSISDAAKEIYIRKLKEEIQKRGLYEKETILNELKGLTQYIKPFDEKTNPYFTAYRYSSKELYADAFGVFLNEPELLRQKAPTFYKALLNWIEKKPEVKNIYDEIQQRYLDRESVLRQRQEKVVQGYKEGELQDIMLSDNPLTFKQVLTELKREFIDKNAEIIRLQKELEKQGVRLDNNPRYWLEQLPYLSGKVYQYIRDIYNSIIKEAKELNIDIDDIGQYMQYRRALTERKELFNPLMIQDKAAIEQLGYLKNKLGDERYAKIEDFANRFWQARQQIISRLQEARMFSDELMQKIKDNSTYVTFDVQRAIDDLYGSHISGHIYAQVGTVAPLRKNPFVATILKDIALLRAADIKMAAKATVDMLKQYYPEEIKEAKTIWNGKFYEIKEINTNKYGTIIFLENGKPKGYYVSRYIADSFKRDPYEANIVFNTIAKLSSPIKALYVAKNIFFTFWNSFYRDPLAWAKQMPKTGWIPGEGLFKAYKYAIKSIPDAYKDVFKNISTEDVKKLYQEGGLITGTHYAALDKPVTREIDRILMKFGLNEKAYEHNVLKPFRWLWDNLDKPQQFGERLYKIGGYKYLKDLQKSGYPIDEQKIMHIVRTRAGSPDFKRAGTAVQLYNNFLLFSNAGKEGWRASWEAFTEDKSAYIYRTVQYSLIPTVAKYLALAGFIDKILEDENNNTQKIMQKISPNDLLRYNVIPLGLTEKDEAIYFVFPHDFTGQVLAGLLWQALIEEPSARTAGKTLQFLTEGMPYTGLNPLISTVFSDIPNYLMGKPIIDTWSGRQIVSEQRMLARRVDEWKALEPFLKYMWNKLGGSSMFYRFSSSDIQTIQSELGKILDTPFVGRGLERFIRVSNYGEHESLNKIMEEVRSLRADELLNIKDAIMQNLTSETPKDVATLYSELFNSGKIKHTKFSDFKEMFEHIALFRFNEPYINAMLRAKSNEEKMAILQHFLKQSPKAVNLPSD